MSLRAQSIGRRAPDFRTVRGADEKRFFVPISNSLRCRTLKIPTSLMFLRFLEFPGPRRTFLPYVQSRRNSPAAHIRRRRFLPCLNTGVSLPILDESIRTQCYS